MMARFFRRWRWLGLAACLVVLIWAAGLAVFAQRVTSQAEPDTAKTDAIVALTGEQNRLQAGLGLLREDLAPRLFFSGVYRGVDVEQLMTLLREDSEEFECCIDLGYVATNTKGNAAETAQWAAEHGVRTMRLVTSDYHMPRSLLEFHRAMPQMAIVPHPVESERVAMRPWYGSLASVKLLATEYSKYLIVLIGG